MLKRCMGAVIAITFYVLHINKYIYILYVNIHLDNVHVFVYKYVVELNFV